MPNTFHEVPPDEAARRMKILAVEDDPRTREVLREALETVGWQADLLARGDEAIDQVITTAYDAVIMDIMLPGCDGITAVRRLRAMNNHTPVLLLSARGELNQRISGLNAGADDYLGKPFSVAEVIARLRAITRRSEGTPSQLRCGDLVLDVPRRHLSRNGRVIDLSPREFRMTEVLMRNVGTVCSRSQLLREVWDYTFDPGTNLVEVYVSKLREKIDYKSQCPLLHTVRGVGYMMSDQTP